MNLSVALTDEVLDRLTDLARLEGVTVNSQAARIIELALTGGDGSNVIPFRLKSETSDELAESESLALRCLVFALRTEVAAIQDTLAESLAELAKPDGERNNVRLLTLRDVLRAPEGAAV